MVFHITFVESKDIAILLHGKAVTKQGVNCGAIHDMKSRHWKTLLSTR
jgi:hypothetical protein